MVSSYFIPSVLLVFLLVALKSKVISADGKYKWYLGATELFF